MKRLLLTGFEPFGGYNENPSALIAGALAGTGVEGFRTRALLLPVSFQQSLEPVETEIARFKPDFVVCFGLAVGRAKLTPERIAINAVDARIADNDGAMPMGDIVRVDGDDGIFSNLPLSLLVNASQAAGVPAEISYSAGTFVCNYVFYRVMEMARESGFSAGFIHVPLLPQQAKADEASMEFSKMTTGVRAMLGALTLPRVLAPVENFDADAETSNRLPI